MGKGAGEPPGVGPHQGLFEAATSGIDFLVKDARI